MSEEELIEQLANEVHASWAHWMEYLFLRSQRLPDGDVLIPSELVERWQRQVNTPYEELSEKEKDSDREQVTSLLPSIHAFINGQILPTEHKRQDLPREEFLSEKTIISHEEFHHPLEVEFMEHKYMPREWVVSFAYPEGMYTKRMRILNIHPQVALNLLEWLEEKRELLEQLAQETEEAKAKRMKGILIDDATHS